MSDQEGTFYVHATRTRPPVEVSADGTGVVSHVGARLLADLAEWTTLTGRLSELFAARVAPQTAHDPGRVLVDVAVMLADGGECISDIATLADQPGVFGPVASDSTCWRVLDAITDDDLAGIAVSRAAARQVAWAQRAEATGAALPASMVAGGRCSTVTGGRCWSSTPRSWSATARRSPRRRPQPCTDRISRTSVPYNIRTVPRCSSGTIGPPLPL
jgi:Transposase DDE domain group 1